MVHSAFAIGDATADRVAEGAPTRSAVERVTLGVVIVGAIAVVLLSLPYKAFDLDRFFVPKELALHATAAIAGLTLLARRPEPALSRVDTLLVGFLLLGVVSALFAENWRRYDAGERLRNVVDKQAGY